MPPPSVHTLFSWALSVPHSFIKVSFMLSSNFLPRFPREHRVKWQRRFLWWSFTSIFFSIFFLLSPSFTWSRLFLPRLSSEVPMDRTRNVSDSFLRKLHPLPVCVPPHCHLPLPWPPCPLYFSLVRHLGRQPLENIGVRRNPPLTESLMRLQPDEKSR